MCELMLALQHFLPLLALLLRVRDLDSLTLLQDSAIFVTLLATLLDSFLNTLRVLLGGLPLAHLILFSQVVAIVTHLIVSN